MKIIDVFFVLMLFCSCHEVDRTGSTSESAVPVKVIHPRTDHTAMLTASGSILSSEIILMSFKTGGVVDNVFVEEGQFVRKGTRMASLVTTELDAQLRQSELNVEKLERDEQRLLGLVGDTIATIEQLQNVQSSLSSAREQSRILRYNRQISSLHAPASGMIVKRQINKGEYKSPGSGVFELAGISADDSGKWTFRISVSDRDRMQLNVGQHAEIQLDALPETVFEGVVRELGSVPDEFTGTYDGYISFDARDSHLVYGLIGKVKIHSNSQALHTVLPVDAFVSLNNGKGKIFLLDADSSVREVEVTVMGLLEHEIVIREKLPESAWIITAGKHEAIPGKKARLVK